MSALDNLLTEQKKNILKALKHLEYSFKKIQKLPIEISTLTEEQLEAWESFVARLCRASDIYVAKYLRTFIRKGDPAFEGTIRDILNQSEKLGLIDNAETWLSIRELRNKSAHDYDDEKLEELLKEAKALAPVVLNVKKKLK